MLVLTFPGQGSQRPGMGAPWQLHPSWRLVQELSEVVGRDISHLLTDADAQELKATRNAQLATFALSLVILDATRAAIELPDAATPVAATAQGPYRVVAFAGHSLGEYTALVAAGALSPGQGAVLVSERGEAMQAAADANPGTMSAIIGLGPESVAEACASVEGAWVANDNSPGQVVIAGAHEGVAAASEAALRLGAKRAIPLQVGGAFHSPLMRPAQDRLDQAISAAQFETTASPVIANVDAGGHTSGFAKLLSAQLCSGVRWRLSMATAAELGGR
ncbi:MAG TPA: ACP S-malonyltransferase, partial [Acidimicrobiales bacterium]|nr:ACP S-malonyltransferase [Acidimicrobiales bacterium]